MDGVLADLFGHVGALHDVEHYNQMTGDQWEEFFKNSNAYELFRNLPAFATANKLLQIVKQHAGGYTILSSPLNFDKAGSIKGKKEWLSKHITVPADGMIFDHEKYKYARQPDGTPNILIDDYGVNITKWKAAGGIPIKYQADENDLDYLNKKLVTALTPQVPQSLNESIDIISESEKFIDINGTLNYRHYIRALESKYKNKPILEELDDKDVDYIKNLKYLSANPVIGEKYVPIVVSLLVDDLHIQGHNELCVLEKIEKHGSVDEYTFRTPSGNTKIFPDREMTNISYTELFLFNDRSKYEKFNLMISLKFNKKLPGSTLTESTSIQDHKDNFVAMFKKFLPLAMHYLKIDSLPEMKFEPHIRDTDQPTFGKYNNGTRQLHVALLNRHPNDILRTTAHELCHYKQDINDELNPESGVTGSPEENEAHVMAGIIMRHFNKQYPEYLDSDPITEDK